MSNLPVFEFGDGHPHGRDSQFDSRSGKLSSWTRDDFVYAINAYAKAKGPRQAASIIQQLCGMADPTLVPSYMMGVVIAVMAKELTIRPFRAEVRRESSRPILRLADGRHRTIPIRNLDRPPPQEDA